MSLNILITGSSGFLGSKLCELLGDGDHIVTAIDIAPPSKKFSSINYVVSAVEDYLNTNINILSDQLFFIVGYLISSNISLKTIPYLSGIYILILPFLSLILSLLTTNLIGYLPKYT